MAREPSGTGWYLPVRTPLLDRGEADLTDTHGADHTRRAVRPLLADRRGCGRRRRARRLAVVAELSGVLRSSTHSAPVAGRSGSARKRMGGRSQAVFTRAIMATTRPGRRWPRGVDGRGDGQRQLSGHRGCELPPSEGSRAADRSIETFVAFITEPNSSELLGSGQRSGLMALAWKPVTARRRPRHDDERATSVTDAVVVG